MRIAALADIQGNLPALRAVLAAAAGSDVPSTAAWSAPDLGERLTTVGEWPIFLSLDEVCFCHGSPRRDDEVITRATPDAAIADSYANRL